MVRMPIFELGSYARWAEKESKEDLISHCYVMCNHQSGADCGVSTTRLVEKDALHSDPLGDRNRNRKQQPCFCSSFIKHEPKRNWARPEAGRLLEPSMTARIDSDRIVPPAASSRRDDDVTRL